jgi:hypothetical protein
MALRPRDVPLTREQVAAWVAAYQASPAASRGNPKAFLAARLNALNLPDTMVNTSEHADLGDQTSLLDMIISDLPSYGIGNP